jgi:hypothetical protein
MVGSWSFGGNAAKPMMDPVNYLMLELKVCSPLGATYHDLSVTWQIIPSFQTVSCLAFEDT